MHTLPNKQCTTCYHSAEGEFKFNSIKSGENKPCVCTGWQQTRVSLPQTTIWLFIGGEGAIADVAKGVAGLQFGFLTVWRGLSFLPLTKELLERLEFACFFLVCGLQGKQAQGWGTQCLGTARKHTPPQQLQRKNEVKEQVTSPKQTGACHVNAGLQLTVDASYWQSERKSIKTSALEFKDLLGGVSAAKCLFGCRERIIS